MFIVLFCVVLKQNRSFVEQDNTVEKLHLQPNADPV